MTKNFPLIPKDLAQEPYFYELAGREYFSSSMDI